MGVSAHHHLFVTFILTVQKALGVKIINVDLRVLQTVQNVYWVNAVIRVFVDTLVHPTTNVQMAKYAKDAYALLDASLIVDVQMN